MNNVKIELQSCQNLKAKLNSTEQVLMEYWEMNIEKVNEFNFLNEQAE